MTDNIKLIQKSIAKWEAIRDGKGVDQGPYNCPLCAEYYWYKECVGCPIREHTGEACCINTPYEKWTNHHDELHFLESIFAKEITVFTIHCDECKQLVEEELDFLTLILAEAISSGQEEKNKCIKN